MLVIDEANHKRSVLDEKFRALANDIAVTFGYHAKAVESKLRAFADHLTPATAGVNEFAASLSGLRRHMELRHRARKWSKRT